MRLSRAVFAVVSALVVMGNHAFAQSVYMFHAWDNKDLNLEDCIARASDALQSRHFKINFTDESADGRDVFGSGRSVVVLIHCVRMQSGVHAIIIASSSNSKVAERTRDQLRTKLFNTPPSSGTDSPVVNAKQVPGTSSASVRQTKSKSGLQSRSEKSAKPEVVRPPKQPVKHYSGKISGKPGQTQDSARHDAQQKHSAKKKIQAPGAEPTSAKNLPAPAPTRCHPSRQISTQCRLRQKAHQQPGNTLRSVNASMRKQQ